MIELIRFKRDKNVTIGRLKYEEMDFYTVEKPWRDNNANVSCIPDGLYKMRRFSDLHGYRSSKDVGGYDVWEITEVCGRTFILIHVANGPHNVEGCIGLGKSVYSDLSGVSSSKIAINEFYKATAHLDEMEILISTRAIS